jgi:uncharacterized protein
MTSPVVAKQSGPSPSAVFSSFIDANRFPCVGARSALTGGGIAFVEAGDIRESGADHQILSILSGSMMREGRGSHLKSVVVLFQNTPRMSELHFEEAMWRRLQQLHEIDRRKFDWDPDVSNDSLSPDFALSFGGIGYYVIGLHPAASRRSRQSPFPALAFNPHQQFRRLKANGKYERFQAVIRKRDLALQGSINPMLADHGAVAEARQYSGRAVPVDWRCPFRALNGYSHAL